jgi:hypothetical protein
MIAAFLALPFVGTALASLWIIPAASAVLGGVVALLFGGDWSLALIAALTVGLAVLALRMFGLKAALGVLVVGALLFARRSGEKAGASIQIQKDKANADRAVQRANDARADADRRNSDPSRLRDDDGFKRRD